MQRLTCLFFDKQLHYHKLCFWFNLLWISFLRERRQNFKQSKFYIKYQRDFRFSTITLQLNNSHIWEDTNIFDSFENIYVIILQQFWHNTKLQEQEQWKKLY